jgi:protein SCO1/2
MQPIRLVLWVAVALALFLLAAIAVGVPSLRGTSGEMRASAPLGGAFNLVNHRGEAVTEAVFRGKPSVTLFGFTHCPDVCPTGLMEMSRWVEQLGADADQLRFIFVTVDPERDTLEVMRNYVTAFSDRMIGITGEPEAVHAMVRDYKIYSRRVPLDGGDYTMDHTASMILQDADGNFFGTIDRTESTEAALAKLRHLVAG